MIRLAEVYLNYAEILNELGTDRSTAVEYINKVRRRVNMTDLNASDFGSYDLLLARIKHERVMDWRGETSSQAAPPEEARYKPKYCGRCKPE